MKPDGKIKLVGGAARPAAARHRGQILRHRRRCRAERRPGQGPPPRSVARRSRRISRTASEMGDVDCQRHGRRPHHQGPDRRGSRRSTASSICGARRRPRARQERAIGGQMDPAKGSAVMRLSDLRDKKVLTVDGEKLGRVHEVHCEQGRVTALMCGAGGLFERWTDKRGAGACRGNACARSATGEIVVTVEPPQRKPSGSRTPRRTPRPSGRRSKR